MPHRTFWLWVRQQLPRVNVPHISIAMEPNGGTCQRDNDGQCITKCSSGTEVYQTFSSEFDPPETPRSSVVTFEPGCGGSFGSPAAEDAELGVVAAASGAAYCAEAATAGGPLERIGAAGAPRILTNCCPEVDRNCQHVPGWAPLRPEAKA